MNQTKQYRTGSDRATAILTVKNISSSFNGKQVLHDISFTVHHGEIVTIIGPNGSGKTTLLKTILGVTESDSGNITVEYGANIGYMPQKMAIDSVMPLTVERFLQLHSEKEKPQNTHITEKKPSTLAERFAQKHSSWSTNKKHDSIFRIAKEVGIDTIFKHQMHSISGGEMQRVLLAYALLSSPDLLILDEPVQGMDLKGQTEFYNLLNTIRKQRQCAILMVSHDLHMVMQATDQVICMNHHICCQGTPEAVSNHPEYAALFGKEQSKTMGVYTHHHDHHHDISGDVITNKEEE